MIQLTEFVFICDCGFVINARFSKGICTCGREMEYHQVCDEHLSLMETDFVKDYVDAETSASQS